MSDEARQAARDRYTEEQVLEAQRQVALARARADQAELASRDAIAEAAARAELAERAAEAHVRQTMHEAVNKAVRRATEATDQAYRREREEGRQRREILQSLCELLGLDEETIAQAVRRAKEAADRAYQREREEGRRRREIVQSLCELLGCDEDELVERVTDTAVARGTPAPSRQEE